MLLSQYPSISLDDFWDLTPNVEADGRYGLTLPRLNGLLDAYQARRRRELVELAVAQHDPGKLDVMYPARETPANGGEMSAEKWW